MSNLITLFLVGYATLITYGIVGLVTEITEWIRERGEDDAER